MLLMALAMCICRDVKLFNDGNISARVFKRGIRPALKHFADREMMCCPIKGKII